MKLQRMIQQHPTVVGVTLRLGFTYSDRPQTHSGCVVVVVVVLVVVVVVVVMVVVVIKLTPANFL